MVTKLLATNPEDRYGSSAELLGHLGRVRNGLPPVVAPSPNEATTAAPESSPAPADAGGAEAGADGGRSRRSLWILASFAALIAVLGVVNWGLLRDPGGSGAPRAEVGASEESPKGPERARPGHERVRVPVVKGLSEREARKRLA